MRILIVEDDEILRDSLAQYLGAERYAIDTAADGLTGWEYTALHEYDLMISDVIMPRLDGIALCQKLRRAGRNFPILLLTVQAASNAKTAALEAGADDYVVKPFDLGELSARVRALLRRGKMNPLTLLQWDELSLNSSNNEVRYAGALLDLTAKEYAMLEMMMRESHRVFSKEEMLESLWSAEEMAVDSTLRSLLWRLRHKLTAVGAPPDFIVTVHGRGYHLKSCQSSTDSANIAPSPFPPMPLEPLRQAYLAQLNETWQNHRSRCLERIECIQSTLDRLASNHLNHQLQVEAHRIAHTLVGSLGLFELFEAMQIAQQLEVELHPDIHLEPDRAGDLQLLLTHLTQQVERAISLLERPSIVGTKPPDRQSTAAKTRVLFIDDDPIFLQMLPQQLAHYGFEVTTIEDPQQFWTILEAIQPDVLVLDIHMSRINGLDLCQQLREHSAWQKLPIIFLSILSDPQIEHHAFVVGGDDYLCKPVTAQTLSDRINHRLQRIKALLDVAS